MILSSFMVRKINKESKKVFIGSIQKVTLIFVCFTSFWVDAKTVGSASEFLEVLESVADMKERRIYMEDGIYRFDQTIYIDADNTKIYSLSGNPKSVVLEGLGMRRSRGVNNLIRISASDVEIRGVTMRNAGNHLIQIAGESDADRFILRDSILQNSFEQMVKVSASKRSESSADEGLIERCVFEYSAGIGPQWYIGGVDAHKAKNWIIRNNQFWYIASPSRSHAEHAIHFWNGSENNIIENNIIIDSDRGIGFGLNNKGNIGGVIRNNKIYHRKNNHPFADAGIILENSPGTLVQNNIVIQDHDYPRAIEYRFPGTTNVVIEGNITNRAIAGRDGGHAELKRNKMVTRSAEQEILAIGANN